MSTIERWSFVKEWDGVELTEFDKGWLAGLLEGEGSFGYYETPRKGGGTPIRRLIAVLKMCDEDVVRRAQKLVEVGSLQVHQRTSRRPEWTWTVCGQQALMVMEIIYPYMGARRREQIANAVNRYQVAIAS
jgi:hypothetical protein